MARIGSTDLDVHPLCLGGNVFGWTADRRESFAVLDAFVAAGGSFIDTADVYSAWQPGSTGGESETIIGEWMDERGNRDDIVLATKVGKKPDRDGLAPETIQAAVEESLKRLQTDRIDLLYAHADDPDTPLDESLGALDAFVRAGYVRFLGASNYTAERLAEALAVSDREGLARYAVLQPEYNLIDRFGYEGPLGDLCAAEGVACVPYFGLAKGFLTGKYRPGGETGDSPRAAAALAYLDDPRGERILGALDVVAAAHDVPVASVALAWLLAQDTVAAPIASARTPEQLPALMEIGELELSGEELLALTAASAA